MRYVTSIERIGIEKGKEEGRQEGLQTGLRRGLLTGIEVALEIKFGSLGLELLPEISQIQDGEILEAIQRGIKTANSLAEIRQIYQ